MGFFLSVLGFWFCEGTGHDGVQSSLTFKYILGSTFPIFMR